MKLDRRGWAPWVLLGVIVAGAFVFALWPRGGSESVKARTQRLASELRCVDCEGLSVAESSTTAARAQRRDLEARVRDGQSDAEIRGVYMERYGDAILLKPASDGIALLVWALPVGALVLSAGGVGLAVRRWRRVPDGDGGLTEDPATAEVAPRRQSPGRRVLVVGGLVAFAAGSAIALAFALGARVPGGNPTGRDPDVAAVSAASRERTLVAAAEARPEDVDAQLALARFRLGRQDFAGALEAYQTAATLDPSAPEPFAYSGWVIRLQGFPDEGLLLVDKALEVDPQYPDARFFRGLILLRDQANPAAAVAELQQYLVVSPDGPMADQVRNLLAEAVSAASTTTSTTSPR